MPSQLDTSELREKIAARVREWFGEPVLAVEDEILSLLEAHIQQEKLVVSSKYITTRQENDGCIRVSNWTMLGISDAALDIITTRLTKTNTPPAEQEVH